MKKLILITTLLLLNTFCLAQQDDESPFELAFDVGLESGKYKIPITDEGDYKGLVIGARLGFNLGNIFIGGYGKLSTASFTSARSQGSVNRVSNPLPDENSTLWGPSFAYKFKWVHLYYSYLFESHKFDSDVDSNGTPTNLFYRYEGTGHEFGLGIRIYGSVFLTYNYRISELGEFKQKINGVYTENADRTHPLKINTHVFALRIPLNLSKIPSILKGSVFGQ
jgi:hypothetical protein